MRPTAAWSSLLLTFALLEEASAIWPFPQKRFTSNSFIDAKALGLEDANRIVAFGDFDGSQFLDVVALSKDQTTLTVYLWDHEQFKFHKNATIQSPETIINVVPGDFTRDGKLDLLVMTAPTRGSSKLDMFLYIGSAESGFDGSPLSLPASSFSQPTPLDFTGELRIDLLGHSSGDDQTLKLWKNVWKKSDRSNLFDVIDSGLSGMSCHIPNPHSNAVLDLDGDCLADLFLVCEDPKTQKLSFQVWLNDRQKGFTFKQTDDLPRGAGAITFADIDRDGTMDMIFPTCESVSTSTGLGHGCSINIVYNKQKPTCASSASASPSCRSPEDLCTADPLFHFDLRDIPSNDGFVRIPLSDIIPGVSSLLMFDTSYSPPIPLPLRFGDADLDGYPDMLAITVAQDDIRTPRLIWNTGCGAGVVGCAGKKVGGRRGFALRSGNGIEILDDFRDVRGVSWVDMDEDGTLDIMVQRTGAQGQGTINFIQNNVFHDAFFLKAIVLNGACNGICVPEDESKPSYHPFGVSYSGATYKYTILSPDGTRSAAQVSQLPQTGYHSLLTPYSFFGLGRTNNYIENLFVGSTKRSSTTPHFINMEGVIPNSRVVITPPTGDGDAWRKELYLRPGEWIPWVTFTLVVATIILGVVVAVFHFNEKREDELERRRALHHINFDAL